MGFAGTLTVTVPLDDRGVRTLIRPLVYVAADGASYTVPAGTPTDYASVPRLLHLVLPPTGAYTYPAVLHDYLYRTGHTTRARADALFLEAMVDANVGWCTRWVMWAGVRLGGRAPWRRYRRRP